MDVSTGAIYARKEFYEPQWAKGEERRRQQKKGWPNQIHREIREENLHVSMTTLVD